MITIYFLPLAVSQSLLCSAVFVTMILGYFLLDEQLSQREILTIIGGVAGVLILLNPEVFGNNYEVPGQTKKQKEKSTFDYVIGLFFALLFSVFSSMRMISIKKIGEGVHTSIKNYYFGLVTLVVTLIANLFIDPEIYKFWKIGTD